MTAPRALALDMYGTLVDPIRVWRHLESLVGEHAQPVAALWRQKQLEYSFRLAAMERYEDFETLTGKALDYALAAHGCQVAPVDRARLLAQYDNLERFPDVEPGLRRLRRLGLAATVFSNGTPRMLTAILRASGLDALVDGFVSVDEVSTYKPSPRAYHHAARRLGRPIGDVLLVSSNPFDVVGARAAGMQAAWVSRSGGLFDTLAPPPPLVVATLVELAEAMEPGRAR